ncbi:MAG: DUF4433 domain-containing protein [Chlorobi bacterium]|nr:DUF4433 domain-containing protein [Chlorobiota bacterium]
MQNGIYSHQEAEKRFPERKRIENEQVYKRRKEKGLSKYANLYINPRNPMLYRIYKGLGWKVVVVGIDASIIDETNALISIGNAARKDAGIYESSKVHMKKLLKDIRSIEYWDNIPNYHIKNYLNQNVSNGDIAYSSQVLIMSEVLIPNRVPKKYIRSVYVPSEEVKKEVERLLESCEKAVRVEISVVPDLFFEPERKIELFPNMWIAYGDMFFADAEVLTISVNVVGVMGKGLASRFKYMFPEAYVRYQELCKSGELAVGKPYLLEMADTNGSMKYRKFLLFPTKKHWREKSKIDYIKKGLEYLKFKVDSGEWQMKSIALPALGCGLGGLDWKDVGRLMVNELKPLAQKGIKIIIYVPKPKEEYFSKEFYLKK